MPTSERKYYVTTYVIKVLSEDEHVENMTPYEVAEAIDTGPCVGVTETNSEEVTAERMASLLEEYGSEPGFFRLDEEGNEED